MSFLVELQRLCDDAGLNDRTYDTFAKDLVTAHSEPHRHYHTVEHIEAVLAHLATLQARTVTTGFAAFFHDAIYDPTAPDNEARSASLARATLSVLEVPEADDVAAIINATAGHQFADGLPAHAAGFLDADLAILGQSSQLYHAYSVAIRAEYQHLSDADYSNGRIAVLESFIDRPTLFFTDAGRDLWEAQARANVAEEISALRDAL